MTRKFNVTDKRFNPSGETGIDAVKAGFDALQDVVEEQVPDCARKTLALRNMEVACMYAVKAIAAGDE